MRQMGSRGGDVTCVKQRDSQSRAFDLKTERLPGETNRSLLKRTQVAMLGD